MRSAASSVAIRETSCGDLLVGALADELLLVVLVELLEDIRLQLAVLADGLDDLLALVVRRRLDEVGDLGRVQVGELAEREAQPRRRHMADERLEVGPVQERTLAVARAQRARQPAAQLGRAARIDPDDAATTRRCRTARSRGR